MRRTNFTVRIGSRRHEAPLALNPLTRRRRWSPTDEALFGLPKPTELLRMQGRQLARVGS